MTTGRLLVCVCIAIGALATYYGDQYVGQTMACGGTYRHRKLVAAARNRRLSCGTVVRIKNLRNGRTVRVRIKDYMARDADAIIDVSRRAARRLRFLRAGRVRVRVSKVHD